MMFARDQYAAAKTAAKLAGAYQTGLFAARTAYRGARKLNNVLYGRRMAAAARRKYASRVPKRRLVLRPKKTLKAVAKEVNSLKKKVAVLNTKYTKKYRTLGALTCLTNQCAYQTLSVNSASVLEGVIDSVKYFNPSAPGTLINVDLTAPTYQNKVRFTKSYVGATIRNNFSVPCYVDIYMCVAKRDTSIAPETAISNSFTDMTNAVITNSPMYPTDAHDFKDLWKIMKHKRIRLDAGKEFTFSSVLPAFDFDVSLSDSQTESFLKYFHGAALLLRIEGILGHGATSGTGMMPCGVDYEFRRIHTVEYSGGVNTEYIELDDNTSAISGTHQCSQLDNEQAAYAR